MRLSVEKAWPTLARNHEGVLPFMYLDSLNYLTIGIGTLMDAVTAPEELLALLWYHKTTKVLATRKEIAAEYEVVQNRPDLSPLGGNAFAAITNYRISNATMDRLLLQETKSIYNRLVQNIPELPTWQADAQLSMLDMGYQLGPNFVNLTRYKSWRPSIFDQKFNELATLCKNYSIHRRWQNRSKLYSNAAQVIDWGINQETLWGLTPDKEKMEMALVDEVGKYVLNMPMIDDPMTGTKRSLANVIADIRQDTSRTAQNIPRILGEVDQTEELLTTVLAEVDQTEEGLVRIEAVRSALMARLAAALNPPTP